ncbi:hypothetical protein THAOC_13131 [Thalassiosira oceanica]|uniref:RPA-interacting protein C-terminal domain-containing protein n=1 Tax=Thalassiosira oceanica TaxID=159749 RepID=K0SLW3_THAOC|nr:hypothetical protein THAOC_13131 [Thalassiosira oceanica]|eukprot:EJK65969.1 hypothetical protein THAOC_13131 [Thalassiosira oceanica]
MNRISPQPSRTSSTAASSRRASIKSNTVAQSRNQWKDNLRKELLSRAKKARLLRLKRARQGSSDMADTSLQHNSVESSFEFAYGQAKRDREEGTIEITDDGFAFDEINSESSAGGLGGLIVDHTPSISQCVDLDRLSSGNSGDNVIGTARALVEQELQRAINGVNHARQIRPRDGAPPCKRVAVREESSFDCEMNSEGPPSAYQISQEEFAQLLSEVTDELQREDELLEEELWELERAEAMERELRQQVDDFESWEELERRQNQALDQDTYYMSPMLSNSTPLVSCPICHRGNIKQTTVGGIQCSNFSTGECDFQLDTFNEGLTLGHLQSQLATVYDEHSEHCEMGILKFRVENKHGLKMLRASCDECSADVIVL